MKDFEESKFKENGIKHPTGTVIQMIADRDIDDLLDILYDENCFRLILNRMKQDEINDSGNENENEKKNENANNANIDAVEINSNGSGSGSDSAEGELDNNQGIIIHSHTKGLPENLTDSNEEEQDDDVGGDGNGMKCI